MGDTYTLRLIGMKPDEKLSWKSAKKKRASVTKSGGVVTAKKAGKVVISTEYAGKTFQCKITVTEDPALQEQENAVEQPQAE